MMDDQVDLPDGKQVYSLFEDGYKVQLVRLALRLDVFTPLAAGPATAEEVAAACGGHPIPIRALLDHLVCLDALTFDGSAYALTPTAAAFLVPGRPAYAGGIVLAETDPAMWEGILDAIRTGRPASYPTPWAQDAWLESYRTDRFESSRKLWETVGIAPGSRPGLRVLDLACGCAIKSLVLAQADPTVRITCIDSPDVLEVARDLAARLGVADQAAMRPGDLLRDRFGEAAYDAALLGQISYYLTAEQNLDLFRRVYAALKPGGVLVIDAYRDLGMPTEIGSLVTVVTWGLSGGKAHTFEEYQGWLEQARFASVTEHTDRWLSAVRSG